MPNPTVRAAALVLPTRRLALATLAGAGTALALAKVAKAAPTSPIERLWLELLVARGAYAAAWLAYSTVHRMLPWWAAPGPSMMNSAGELVGPVTGWPAIQGMAPPEGIALRTVRPDPHDIENLYWPDESFFGERIAREKRERRMASLNERLALRTIEEARFGLPALCERLDVTSDAALAALDAVEELEPGTLDVLAAQVMAGLVGECLRPDTAAGCPEMRRAAHTLRALLPHISGEVARDAVEVVAHPDRPLEQMRFYAGLPIGGGL